MQLIPRQIVVKYPFRMPAYSQDDDKSPLHK